jgi:hypothetical protein
MWYFEEKGKERIVAQGFKKKKELLKRLGTRINDCKFAIPFSLIKFENFKPLRCNSLYIYITFLYSTIIISFFEQMIIFVIILISYHLNCQVICYTQRILISSSFSFRIYAYFLICFSFLVGIITLKIDLWA